MYVCVYCMGICVGVYVCVYCMGICVCVYMYVCVFMERYFDPCGFMFIT